MEYKITVHVNIQVQDDEDCIMFNPNEYPLTHYNLSLSTITRKPNRDDLPRGNGAMIATLRLLHEHIKQINTRISPLPVVDIAYKNPPAHNNNPTN